MLSLVDKDPTMETNSKKLANNSTHEAVELLGLSSSDSLDSPSFSQFQVPKQKRKVRFKKPFRSHSRNKAPNRDPASKKCKCIFIENFKVISFLALVAVLCGLFWYIMTLSAKIQELQAKFSDFEAGSRNTPEALHVIHSNLKQLNTNISMIYLDVRKNMENVENISSEVNLLKGVASNLKESIASAPAIQQLPKDMQSLSENVANFGSKLNALENSMKDVKDQHTNLQTTTQNLSTDLDSVKVTIQEIGNSSELQTKSLNATLRDIRIQNLLHESSQRVDQLQTQLLSIANTVNLINSTVKSLNDLPAKVKTLDDAIVFINNSTLSQNSRLFTLENFLQSNLSLLTNLDLERSSKNLAAADIEDYLNRTVSESILRLIDQGIFHVGAVAGNKSIHSLEQTHDVLVLLAALLRKFEHIPEVYVLNSKNATDLVEHMMQQMFTELISPRDAKMQTMESTVQNLTLCACIPNTHLDESVNHLGEITTPVFTQSTYSSENSPVGVENAQSRRKAA